MHAGGTELAAQRAPNTRAATGDNSNLIGLYLHGCSFGSITGESSAVVSQARRRVKYCSLTQFSSTPSRK